jgi:monoamine oxidase
MPHRPPSCIVIGAGLAGLAAALRLIERGWKVDVFEACPWFGGRVYTHKFAQAPGLNCELGGEWIGNGHTRMFALCKQFRLPLQKHRYAFALPMDGKPAPFYQAGSWPFRRGNQARLNTFLANFSNPKVYDECKQQELDRYDWWTWLATMGFDRSELLRRDLMDSTDFGETIRLTSAYIAAGEYSTSNRYDEMDWKVVGGNHKLPEAMLRRITGSGNGTVHLNKRVTEVTQEGTKVRVNANSLNPQSGGTLRWTARATISREADFCICAVPARTLNTIVWNPPLPDDQVEAADHLQYCRIVKTVVLYQTKFWRKGQFRPSGGGYSWFTDGASDFCFDATQGQDNDPAGILCSYAIGDKADDLARAPFKKLQKWITEDIEDACGLRRGTAMPIDIQRQAWQENPFTHGAYGYYRSGQWFTVRPLLSRSHLRVHFAGEHLDEDWQGFMEGAVRTGEDAAMLI